METSQQNGARYVNRLQPLGFQCLKLFVNSNCTKICTLREVRYEISHATKFLKFRVFEYSNYLQPGYEKLCSLLAVSKRTHNYGTTSMCRVPLKDRPLDRRAPAVETGCISCCSSDVGAPIWWDSPATLWKDVDQETKTSSDCGFQFWKRNSRLVRFHDKFGQKSSLCNKPL